jgi:hypothetical protein
MHTNRERRLPARLLRYGGPYVTVTSVPWQLREADPAQAITEEEPIRADRAQQLADAPSTVTRGPMRD